MIEKPESMKTVVIVDDEEDVVAYLSALLGDNGYLVRTANNGRDGYEIVKQVKPDLVCLDILMPVETGVSLFKKIRMDEDTGGIPVIIISGMDFQEKVATGNGGTLNHIPPPEKYLEKPVKPAQFLDTVREVIG